MVHFLPHFFMFTTKILITDDAIFSLFISALEGGSNYWYMIQDAKEGTEKGDLSEDFDGQQVYPFNGGWLMIDDSKADEPTLKKPTKVDRARLEDGLQIMANQYPDYFARLLDDNSDAGAGDVFLQCVVLGEVVYG